MARRIRATQSDHLICARGKQAAEFLDKILRGMKPGDISVEQADKFELVIDLRTAKSLGLTIPESFLLRADTVAGTKCEFRLVRVTTAHE